MVEKIKKVIDILAADNKPVWLAALLKMDEFVDKWSLIISAPWINTQNIQESFEKITDLLKRELDSGEISTIARVGLLPKSEHLAEELLTKQEGVLLKDAQINGNKVHEGYIIVAKPNLVLPQENLFAGTSAN